MAIKVINIGTSANKGDGEPLRTAFDKINDNFSELSLKVTNLETGGVTVTTGDIKGSVFGDDSTLLVDGINSRIPSSVLHGALPAIDGSALTGLFSGAFADLTGKPTTIAGYGITDTLSSAADDITVGDAAVTIATSTGDITIDAQGSDTDIIFKGTDDASDITALTLDMSEAGKAIFNSDVAIGTSPGHYIDITKASTTIASNNNNLKLTGNGAYGVELQYGGATKLFAGNTGIEVNGDIELGVGGAKLTNNTSDLVIEPAGGKNLNINNNSGTTVFSVLSNVIQMTGGIQIKQGVEETFATLTGSTGVVEHDCNNGQVFYHTGAAGDITANFTNLNSTQEHTTNLIVIINQGATPYEVTAVQIGGAAQTINWQGGSAPTGNANGIDSFSFTILNDGGTYVVLGQMVDFT